jgi:hypothetical protein
MWGESEGILRKRSRARRVRFRMLAWQEFFVDIHRQFAERAKRVEGKESRRDAPDKSQAATPMTRPVNPPLLRTILFRRPRSRKRSWEIWV